MAKKKSERPAREERPARAEKPALITHPGYASGDQFAIAAKLINEPGSKVVVCKNDAKPSSGQIESFFKECLDKERVLTVDVGLDAYYDDKALKNAANKEHNKGQGYTITNHGVGTQFVAQKWSAGARDNVRQSWGLQGEDPQVQSWLDTKGLPAGDIQGAKVAVIWCRFSGKKDGGAHPEHDTSHEGVRQMVAALKNDFDTIIIAGDRHPNHPKETALDEPLKDPWTKLQMENTGPKGKVVDLTEFWKGTVHEKAAVSQWSGGRRTGQLKLYDHLNAKSQGLVHLGFRSGNLEALALMGHKVGYMEQKHSLGGPRMDTWQRADPNVLHYDKILLDQVPTRTGRQLTAERVTKTLHASSPEKQLQELAKGDQVKAYAQHVSPQKLGSYPRWEGHADHKDQAGINDFQKGFADTDLASISHFACISVLESAIEKQIAQIDGLPAGPREEKAAMMMKVEDMQRDLMEHLKEQRKNVENQMAGIEQMLASPLLTQEPMIALRKEMMMIGKELSRNEGELRKVRDAQNELAAQPVLEGREARLGQLEQTREALLLQKRELQQALLLQQAHLQEMLDGFEINNHPRARSVPLNLSHEDLRWAMQNRQQVHENIGQKLQHAQAQLKHIEEVNSEFGIKRPAPPGGRPPPPKNVAGMTGLAKIPQKSFAEQIRERKKAPDAPALKKPLSQSH